MSATCFYRLTLLGDSSGTSTSPTVYVSLMGACLVCSTSSPPRLQTRETRPHSVGSRRRWTAALALGRSRHALDTPYHDRRISLEDSSPPGACSISAPWRPPCLALPQCDYVHLVSQLPGSQTYPESKIPSTTETLSSPRTGEQELLRALRGTKCRRISNPFTAGLVLTTGQGPISTPAIFPEVNPLDVRVPAPMAVSAGDA